MDTNNQSTREERQSAIRSKIQEEGRGAAQKWVTIAGSAMAGNKAAQKACAKLIGRTVCMLGDYYSVLSAAYPLMTDAESEADYRKNSAALARKRNLAPDADEYLTNRLGALRRAKGMTQKQLADAAGIPVVTLQKLENGSSRLMHAKTLTVLGIARAMGMTVEEFLGEAIQDVKA